MPVRCLESNVIDTTLGANNKTSIETYGYFEDDFSIGELLRFNTGLHYSFFVVNGRFYQSLQPRISARLLLSSSLSYKLSYARMAQYIHLLSNGGIGLPTDLWVPATKLIRPQASNQVATGLAKNLGMYEISLEAYYKQMKNLIAYKEGASYFNFGNNWEDKIVSGDGESKGIELLIQKKTGRLNGWIGYTLSKTTRQFLLLNSGKEFPYK